MRRLYVFWVVNPGPFQPTTAMEVVDPVEDRHVLEASLKRGFRAIKIKIGEGDLARDVETVSGVRDIIRPGGRADGRLQSVTDRERNTAEAGRHGAL